MSTVGSSQRIIAWLHGLRRLRIRWKRRDEIHEVLVVLTKPLDMSVGDQADREAEEALVDVVASFP
ncbi:hypothetical protein ACWCQP_50065, partial [Streptomyces chartreusis]